MSGLERIVRGNLGTYTPGMTKGMVREDYDAIPALNCSTLKKWIDIVVIKGGCPKKFAHWLENRDESQSEALLIGSALDTLILEPAAFDEKFIVVPDNAPKRPSSRSFASYDKGGKQKPEVVEAVRWWKDFDVTAGDRGPLNGEQHRMIVRMAEAATTSPLTADIFQYCGKRVLQADLLDIPCKGELDLFSDQTEYIFDLKTTRDASLREFSRFAWDLGYHYQAAFYLKLAQALGMEHKKAFCFIAVENVEPHCVAAYTIDFTTDALQYAWKMIQTAAVPLVKHLTRNEWPDYGDFTPLKFPGFAKHEASDFLKEFGE